MARAVYVSETNCITPLGFDVPSNIKNIEKGVSGIQKQDTQKLVSFPFYAASISDTDLNAAFSKISTIEDFTRLEKMMLLALHPIVSKSNCQLNEKVALIVATTKGNITALKTQEVVSISKAHLSELAKTIATFFEFTTVPIVVSNACVSGILAVSVAKRLIQSNKYDAVFIVAGDELSEFVVSGFNSFQAMSNSPCKPYSKNRNGVSLGEATAAVLVTSNPNNAKATVLGDGAINDANHISGPSRTGEGLVLSIQSALNEAHVEASQIDYISAHGTATPFNDEMEAIAFNRLGLENCAMNSLKGYYGHTLGASGLLETVIGIESMLQGRVFASFGFDEIGVSQSIQVIKENKDKSIRYFLKQPLDLEVVIRQLSSKK